MFELLTSNVKIQREKILKLLESFNELRRLNLKNKEVEDAFEKADYNLREVCRLLNLEEVETPKVFMCKEFDERNFEKIKSFLRDNTVEDYHQFDIDKLSFRQESSAILFLEGILKDYDLQKSPVFIHEIYDFFHDYNSYKKFDYNFKNIELKVFKGLVYIYYNFYFQKQQKEEDRN